MSHYQPPSPDQSPDPASELPEAEPRRIMIRMPVEQPRLTYVLLGINVLIYLYYFGLSPVGRFEFLYEWGKVNDLIRDGEYYRLFTSMFLHLNATHILFNGWALYVFGRDVEALFGTARFAIIYFLGGLSGSLASFIFTDALSVGASGAIFAIFGAEMVYFYLNRELHGAAGRQHLNQLIILMVINLALGFASTTGATQFRIDIAGHIGGLIGGVVLAWFIGPSFKLLRDPESESGLSIIDENSLDRWVLSSVLYALGLAIAVTYAVAA